MGNVVNFSKNGANCSFKLTNNSNKICTTAWSVRYLKDNVWTTMGGQKTTELKPGKFWENNFNKPGAIDWDYTAIDRGCK